MDSSAGSEGERRTAHTERSSERSRERELGRNEYEDADDGRMKRLSRKRNLRRHQSAMRTQIVLLLSLALGFLIVLRIAQQPRKWNGAVESIAEGERTAGDYRENRLGKVGIRDDSEVRVPTFEECPRRRASLEGEESDEAILVHRAAPGSMRYNHMAMIDKLDNGSLVLVWQFSSGIEGVADQGLALSLSSDASGRSWSRPRVIPIQREAEKGALDFDPPQPTISSLLSSLNLSTMLSPQELCGVQSCTLNQES